MENKFAENLKYIREHKNISQQKIADDIGVDRSTIGYWENGKADPTMNNVCKLATALNVDVVSLIGGNLNSDNVELIGEYELTDETDQLLFSKAKMLNEEEKKTIISIMDAIHKDIDKELDK